MERILTLIILSLLWCNVGFAAEREPGTDKNVYMYLKEKIYLKENFYQKLIKIKEFLLLM